MHLETKLDMPMVIRWEPVLRAPFGNVNRLSPVHRWPNHLFRSTASIKWSEDSVSHLFATIQRVFPYTGGYSRKVSSGSETSVTRLYTPQTSRDLTIYHRSQVFHLLDVFKSGCLFRSQHMEDFFSQPAQDGRIVRKHCHCECQGRRCL